MPKKVSKYRSELSVDSLMAQHSKGGIKPMFKTGTGFTGSVSKHFDSGLPQKIRSIFCRVATSEIYQISMDKVYETA